MNRLNIKNTIFISCFIVNAIIILVVYNLYIKEQVTTIANLRKQLEIKERLLLAKEQNYIEKDMNLEKLKELQENNNEIINISKVSEVLVELTNKLNDLSIKDTDISVYPKERIVNVSEDSIDIYKTKVSIEATGNENKILEYLQILERDAISYDIESIRVSKEKLNILICIYSYLEK